MLLSKSGIIISYPGVQGKTIGNLPRQGYIARAIKCIVVKYGIKLRGLQYLVILRRVCANIPGTKRVDGNDRPPAGVGLASSFAASWQADHVNEQIGLIPCADGGTSLSDWQVGGTFR